MEVIKSGIIGGTREEVSHMNSDKPVVFHCVNHHEAMHYETFSLEVK